MSQVERDVNNMFQTINSSLHAGTTLLAAIDLLLRRLDGDPAKKILKDYMKAGGSIAYIGCDPKEAFDVEEFFRDEGIVFLRSDGVLNGQAATFIFREEDSERVQALVNEFRATHSRGGYVTPETLEAYGKPLRKIRGLTEVEALLFEEKARKNDIKVSMVKKGEDSYTLLFAEQDKKEIDALKIDVAIETTGIAGEALKKQMKYEAQSLVDIQNRVAEYRELPPNERVPFYIVDLHGSQIYVDDSGLSYEGKTGNVKISLDASDFNDRVANLCRKMITPVALTEEEMKEFNETRDKKEFLVEKDKENGRPEYTEEEIIEIQHLIEHKQLYYTKLAMDPPEHLVLDYSLENDDMRMASFEQAAEQNTDAMEREERSHLLDPDILEESKARLYSYEDEIEETVYNKRTEREEDSRGDRARDRYLDEKDRYDSNNNDIPDNREPHGALW